MNLELDDHQQLAINQLKNGSILCGGVGSGKSRTSLVYFYTKICEGTLSINGSGIFSKAKKPKNLYIITTAKKRDSLEWEGELTPFFFNEQGIKVIIDSWNKIASYVDVKDSFFIFDEQRVVGNGTWVKSFLKISKTNGWILLSATPGDTWNDYIPVFIANGFYKNKTEFTRRHIVYNRFCKYPKVDHYVDNGHLLKLRQSILVNMKYVKPTVSHHIPIITGYDSIIYKDAIKNRWDIFKDEPIKDAGALCYLLRKIVNTDLDRIDKVERLIDDHPRIIVFYNFDYELEILRDIGMRLNRTTAEWNGHIHNQVPKSDTWLYLVQYVAGAEAWNCITTDAIIFYSQSYSYKTTTQAAGRIDRRNTPYSDLYYYHVRSNSSIDLSIHSALKKKKDFNERSFSIS